MASPVYTAPGTVATVTAPATGFQAVMVPPRVAKMNRAGPGVVPPGMTKSVGLVALKLLKTSPVGLPPGIVTTRLLRVIGLMLPSVWVTSPAYSVDVPDRWLDVQNGLVPLK